MRKPLLCAAVLLSCLAVPALAQCGPPNPTVDPYVFVLLDISGTMNQMGYCGSGCNTPLQGDHPSSRWTQVRQALYNVLSGIDNVRFGFATFANQDVLRVRAKHWAYQSTGGGPSLQGWGAFPPTGAQEVFGLTWPCTAGATEGCSAANPADLNDAWELARVQRLPKGGDDLTQIVEVYVRTPNSWIYKVRYEPVPGGALGNPLQTTVTTWRCFNSTCSSNALIGSQTVSWQVVGDALAWESAVSTASRTPPVSYFTQSAAADAAGLSACNIVGWEPNTDDPADPYVSGALSYSLKRTTDASDPRGPFFTVGDLIPLDWDNRHKEDVLARLAPNLAADPLAVPDYRTAAYFQDHPAPGETFLRLRDEAQRPLIPFGSSPLGRTVRHFRSWYTGCGYPTCPTITGWADEAANLDWGWSCRQVHLLIVTDSEEDCPSENPCADIAALNSQEGVKTSVIAVGLPSTSTLIKCLAQNGRGKAYFPVPEQDIENALVDFFTNVVGIQP